MRTLTLKDLNLPDDMDVNRILLSKMRSNIENYKSEKADSTKRPIKKYEIFKMELENDNIFYLMLTENLPDGTNKDLYYDINNAYAVYDNLITINENLKAELFERSELYLDENINLSTKNKEIKENDEKLYVEALKNYGGVNNAKRNS